MCAHLPSRTPAQTPRRKSWRDFALVLFEGFQRAYARQFRIGTVKRVSGPCNVRLATTRKRLLHHTSTARGVRKSAQNCPCENPVKIGFLDIHRWR